MREGEAHEFQVGDWVLLSSEDINLQLASRKLGDHQLGPFEVLEWIRPIDYHIDLPLSLDQIHNIFHVDKLSPWKGNEVNGVLPPPPEPVEIEGELEYEVDEILNSRWRNLGGRRKKNQRGPNRVFEYLVSWKGYDGSHDSWQPLENVEGAKDRTSEFHQAHPTADRPPDTTFYQTPTEQTPAN